MRLAISVFVIALNEADRIGQTVTAARMLSDDVVVVDSGSTDGTQAIAESLGARVIHHDWPGYGAQKRFAQQQCRHAWVLNLDADEVMTAALVDEIRATFANQDPPADAYRMRIVDVIPGEAKPRPFAYAYNRIRLYRKDKGEFSVSPVHDVVQMAAGASTRQLDGVVFHFSMRGLGAEITKFNAYTDALVADLRARGVAMPVWRVFVEFPVAFLKAYVLRRHFMGGVYGFLIAMNYAMFRHLRVAKFYEAARRARQTGEALR